MTDATNRAREVIDAYVAGKYLMPTGYGIERTLAENGFEIIDTRTHAAIAREPSDADVERVARLLADEADFDPDTDWNLPSFVRKARAVLMLIGGTREHAND